MIDFRRPTILFGGSFDPIHEGHLHAARSAMSGCPDIKQLIFIPCSRSPGKTPPFATGEQRLEWLRLLAEPEGFGVWDFEVRKGGESFTVETLEEARRQGADKESLFWLLGADSYASFPRWKQPERIRELCRLLVVNRPGNFVNLQSPSDRQLTVLPHPASSTAVRAALQSGRPSPWLPPRVREAMEKICPPFGPYARKQE